MTSNVKIIVYILAAVAVLISISFIFKFPGSLYETEQVSTENNLTVSSTPTNGSVTPEQKKENKLCDWIDESDVIIKLNFVPGVVKDTSYEAGFYFSPIYFNGRLARKDCDYRTGLNFEELKGKGAVQVGVRGYTDSRRRQLENEPISVVLDAEGKPDVGTYIEVMVTD